MFLLWIMKSALALSIVGNMKGKFDLSDIACHETICAVVSDETNEVVILKRAGNKLIVDKTIILDEAKELDLEGIAKKKDGFYIIGSHGLSRRSRKYKPERYNMYQLQFKDNYTKYKVTKMDVNDFFKNHYVLENYYKKALQDNGLNIEGLAYKMPYLYFGLRAPSINGFVEMVRVRKRHYQEKAHKAQSVDLFLGRGIGIREMVSIEEGFLMVLGDSGPADSNIFKPTDFYTIALWDGYATRPNKLKVIKSQFKIEGIEVL